MMHLRTRVQRSSAKTVDSNWGALLIKIKFLLVNYNVGCILDSHVLEIFTAHRYKMTEIII